MPGFRIRFTVRRLMVAVAITAALLLVFVRVARPWSERRAARFHEQVSFHKFGWVWEKRGNQRGCLVSVTTAEGAYHTAMEAKYAWAERHPWLPVAPDPPAPE